MISVRGDAVVIEYDRPAMDAALASDPRMSQVLLVYIDELHALDRSYPAVDHR